ncbi:hypothetical protein KCV07_g544, partial [Aureobasidium melanogenum]
LDIVRPSGQLVLEEQLQAPDMPSRCIIVPNTGTRVREVDPVLSGSSIDSSRIGYSKVVYLIPDLVAESDRSGQGSCGSILGLCRISTSGARDPTRLQSKMMPNPPDIRGYVPSGSGESLPASHVDPSLRILISYACREFKDSRYVSSLVHGDPVALTSTLSFPCENCLATYLLRSSVGSFHICQHIKLHMNWMLACQVASNNISGCFPTHVWYRQPG